jgi:hypothetical protein
MSNKIKNAGSTSAATTQKKLVSTKLTVKGTFSGAINNFARLDLYRSNPDPYDFAKNYSATFVEVFTDLIPGDTYFLDLTGYTTGTFDLNIEGSIAAPITDSFTNTDFKPGYTIQITA